MINKLTAFFMCINFALLGSVGYMMFYPFPVTQTLNEPFPVEPTELKRGDVITVFVEFEKFRDYPVEINKNILCDDGNLVTLAPITSHSPIGYHNIEIDVTIPEKVSNGVCHLEFTNTYHINPLRDETRVRESRDFTIVE